MRLSRAEFPYHRMSLLNHSPTHNPPPLPIPNPKQVAALIPDQSDKGIVAFFETNPTAVENLIRDTRLETAKAAVGTVLKGLSPQELESVIKSLGK